jgi:hypothetical protein
MFGYIAANINKNYKGTIISVVVRFHIYRNVQ